MIDHMNLPVSDVAASRAFYRAALSPLGLPELMEDGDAVGFGVDSWTFGLVPASRTIEPLHLAFSAASEAAVDAFHAAALAAGARDHGGPGLRPIYGPGYYAAYVLDPDGHNIEAVFRGE